MKTISILALAGVVGLSAGRMFSQISAQPANGLPPLIGCSQLRFASENGQPIARETIEVLWLNSSWKKAGEVGTHLLGEEKARREFKTDAKGQISLPYVKGGPYLLVLLAHGKHANGTFQSAPHRQACLQNLEVRGKEILAKP